MKILKNKLKYQADILYYVFKSHKATSLLSLLGMFLAIIIFRYYDGIVYTAWSVNIWDAIFSGRIREFLSITVQNIRDPLYKRGTDQFLESFIWGIWNFPLWLTHIDPAKSVSTSFCLMWSYMFLVLFVFGTALVCYHITNFFTKSKEKSVLAFLFVIGSSTVMMSTGYSGQNEIFYIFFYLLAMLMALKENNKLSYSFLLICVTLNPFMIIFSVLVVASMEKRFVIAIIKSCFLFSLTIFEKFFFIHINTRLGLDSLIRNFFLKTTLPVGFYAISFFAITVFVLVAIYILCDKYAQTKKNLILYSALIMCACCIFSWQHFYRLANYLPFLLICVLIKDNDDSIPVNLFALALLDITMFFIGCTNRNCFTVRYLRGAIQRSMHIVPANYITFWQMVQRFIKPELHIEIFLVSFAAACMVFIFYNILKKENIQFNKSINVKYVTLTHCAAPICIMVVFMTLTYSYYKFFYIPIVSEDTHWNRTKIVHFNNGQEYKKTFTVFEDMKLKQIDICPITWNNKYSNENLMFVELSDSSGNVLLSKSINLQIFKNTETFAINVLEENVKLQKNEEYVLRFKSNLTEQDLPFALKQSPNSSSIAASIWGRK